MLKCIQTELQRRGRVKNFWLEIFSFRFS